LKKCGRYVGSRTRAPLFSLAHSAVVGATSRVPLTDVPCPVAGAAEGGLGLGRQPRRGGTAGGAAGQGGHFCGQGSAGQLRKNTALCRVCRIRSLARARSACACATRKHDPPDPACGVCSEEGHGVMVRVSQQTRLASLARQRERCRMLDHKLQSKVSTDPRTLRSTRTRVRIQSSLAPSSPQTLSLSRASALSPPSPPPHPSSLPCFVALSRMSKYGS
jgi:hypothetical protein